MLKLAELSVTLNDLLDYHFHKRWKDIGLQHTYHFLIDVLLTFDEYTYDKMNAAKVKLVLIISNKEARCSYKFNNKAKINGLIIYLFLL